MTTVLRTACPLDCPDACTLDVTVDEGRLIAVDAAPAGEGNPLTAGWICQKVKHHHRRVYAPERILTPLVRSGPKGSGSFRPVSWDEALDLCTEQMTAALADAGPNAVIPYLYNSSASILNAAALTPMLFARMGAPEVAHTICASTAGAAKDQIFGSMLSADPLDVPHARLIVVWGANPTVSNTHLLPLITAAKKSGARLVVVDPRLTGVAARADLHLAVLPGTDVVLAYAVAHLLAQRGRVDEEFCARYASGVDEFLAAAAQWPVARAAEVCGLSVADIEAFADLISTREPAMLRMGWGLERNRNGGSCWLAPTSLWVLAGHFGRRGSGVIYSTSGASPVDLDRLLLGSAPFPDRGVINMNEVGAIITGDAPRVARPRVLFVQGANPANTAVDQNTMLAALARDDLFTIVHEQVMTDTAEWADVVLPATTHFEASDLVGSYGSYTVQRAPAVIDRVGESWTNNEVAAALADRLGYADPAFHLDAADLAAAASARSIPTTGEVTRPAGATVQFVDSFPAFGDGLDDRARLFDPTSELPLPRYVVLDRPGSLTMISPASGRMITSMFGEFNAPEAVVSLHPADAAARGVTDGDVVEVTNDTGRMTLSARLDTSLRPGVCHVPKGIWLRDFAQRRSVNVLVPRGSSDLGAGACFNDARVDINPVR